MSLEVVTVMHSDKAPADVAKQREELVRRVASSVTFEKSPRLRAFFLHVCRCARENKSEEATEPQIAIYVYGRQPGYNPNEDNIVRSQARVLRMKLEHHFANEGKDEPVVSRFRSDCRRWFGSGGRPRIQGRAPCCGRQSPP